MRILILLDHRGCHVNSLPTDVLLFKWIQSFQHSQDHLSVFPTLFVPYAPSCLCFLALPPFSSRTQISQSCILLLMGSLSILFHQCSYPVILRKILTKLQVHHSSLVDSIQVFGVNHIPFLVSNVFSCRCTS